MNKLKKITNDMKTFIIVCNNIRLNKSNYLYYLSSYTGNVIKQSLNAYYNYWNNYNVIINNKTNIFITIHTLTNMLYLHNILLIFLY